MEIEPSVLFGGQHSPSLLLIWLPKMGFRLAVSLNRPFSCCQFLFKEPTMSDAWLCGAVLCAENPRVHKEHIALMPCLSPFGLTELVFSYRLPLSTTPSQFTEEPWAQVTYPKSHMSGLPEFIPQNCHGS